MRYKTMITYFIPTPETAEQLKTQYRALAMIHHPDRNGNVAIMQEINNQFAKLFEQLKNTHDNANGERYTTQASTAETSADYINVISRLIHFDGITIEIIGRFIWISGDTKPIKDILKELGFKWHSKKAMWYLSYPGYQRKSRRNMSIDEIRNMFGSETVESKPAQRLV